MSFDMVVFGRRLKALREVHRLSRIQLAMNLNISVQHLSNIENGQRRPSIEVMSQLADYFHLSLDSLATGAENNPEAWREISREFSYGLSHLGKVQQLLDSLDPENPQSA